MLAPRRTAHPYGSRWVGPESDSGERGAASLPNRRRGRASLHRFFCAPRSSPPRGQTTGAYSMPSPASQAQPRCGPRWSSASPRRREARSPSRTAEVHVLMQQGTSWSTESKSTSSKNLGTFSLVSSVLRSWSRGDCKISDNMIDGRATNATEDVGGARCPPLVAPRAPRQAEENLTTGGPKSASGARGRFVASVHRLDLRHQPGRPSPMGPPIGAPSLPHRLLAH